MINPERRAEIAVELEALSRLMAEARTPPPPLVDNFEEKAEGWLQEVIDNPGPLNGAKVKRKAERVLRNVRKHLGTGD